MSDESERGSGPRLLTLLIGTAALGAWFVLLWLMFGDVL